MGASPSSPSVSGPHLSSLRDACKSSKTDFVYELTNALWDPEFVSGVVSADPGDVASRIEYFLSLRQRSQLRAVIQDGVDAVAAGIVESGGKEGTVARLVHDLTSCVASPPAFLVLLEQRLTILRHVATADNNRPEVLPEGTRVRRGPDWQYDDQDGGAGNLGTVTESTAWSGVDNRGLRVKWDSESSNTYRWGYEEGGVAKFDLEVVGGGPNRRPAWNTQVSLWMKRHSATLSTLRVSRADLARLYIPVEEGDTKVESRRGKRGPPPTRVEEDVLPNGRLRSSRKASRTMLGTLNKLLRHVATASKSAVDAAVATMATEASMEAPPADLVGVMEALRLFQQQVLLAATGAVVPPKPKSDASKAPEAGPGVARSPSTPAAASVLDDAGVVTLCQYAEAVFRHAAEALEVAAVAAAMVARDSDSAPHVCVAIDTALRDFSVVGGLLPILVTALCLFDRCLPLAVILLPGVARLLSLLAAVNEKLPNVVASERLLHSKESRWLSADCEGANRSGQSAALLTDTKLHWLLDLEKTLASLAGRWAAATVAGLPETVEEEGLAAWLKSGAFSGGLEASAAERVTPPGGALAWEDASSTAIVVTPRAASSDDTPPATPRRDSPLPDAVPGADALPQHILDGGPRWRAAYTVSIMEQRGVKACSDAVAAAALGANPGTRDGDAIVAAVASNTALDAGFLSPAPDGDDHGFDDDFDEDGGHDAVGPGTAVPVSTEASGTPLGAGEALTAWLDDVFKKRKRRAARPLPGATALEHLFFGALVKHGNLWAEAAAALAALPTTVDDGKTAEDAVSEAVMPPPSAAMREAHIKLEQLRKYLKEQHAYDKAGDLARALAVGNDDEDDAAAVFGVGGVTESKLDDDALPPPPASLKRQTSGGGRLWKPQAMVPTSFEDVVQHVGSRCRLLLALAPATHLPGAKQLAAKWHQTLSPPTLAPLLMRWKSMHGDDEDDAAGDAPPAVASLFRTCMLYATKGATAPPAVLLAIMQWRRTRASLRTFGFKALLAVLKNVSMASCRRDALVHLRPALRGVVRGVVDTPSPSTGGASGAAAPDPTNIRHHHGKGLEGAAAVDRDAVQAAFIELFVYLDELLVASSEDGDVATGHMVTWTWGLDMESADHEFMLRVGLVPTLSKLFGLQEQSRRAGKALDEEATSPVVPPAWQPWPLTYVRRALMAGTLTKWELIMHIKAAGGVPAAAGEADGEWWGRHSLGAPARVVANAHTPATILELYEEVLARTAVATGAAATADAAATTIQDAFRGFFVRSVFQRQPSGDLSTSGDSVAAAETTAQFRGRHGASARHFRQAAWSLFRLLAAGAMGGRRGVRKAAAVAEVTAEADANPPGSAAEVTQRAEAALKEVGATHAAGAVGAAGSRYTQWLQAHVLSIITGELELGVQVLSDPSNVRDGSGAAPAAGASAADDSKWATVVAAASPSRSSAPAGAPLALEWAEAEAAVASHLSFLASLRDLAPVGTQLRSARLLHSLLALLACGSPRIQRLVTSLLLDVLPEVSPAAADAAVAEAFPDPPEGPAAATPGAATVSLLLGVIGEVWARPAAVGGAGGGEAGGGTSAPSAIAHPVGYGAGHVALATAAGLTAVAQALLTAPLWAAVTVPTVTAAVEAVVPVLGAGSPPASVFGRAIAAAGVLGGATEVLRVGARAATEQALREAGAVGHAVLSAQWAGTVIRYARGSSLAKVLYNPAAPPSDVEVTSLVPLDARPFPASAVRLTPALAAAYCAIMSASAHVDMPQEEAATIEDIDEDGGPKAAAKAPPPEAKEAEAAATGVPLADVVPTVTDAVAWTTALKVAVFRSAERLLENADSGRVAADAGMLQPLVASALRLVALPTMVGQRFLAQRGHLLHERVLEWGMGLVFGGGPAAGPAATTLSDGDKAMREMAESLSALGFDFELCLKGLELKAGDMERTAEWLLSGEGEVFRAGGGLDAVNVEETENPRFQNARQLATICGKPPRLCVRALEIFQDNNDNAFNWLMDRGTAFVPGLNVGEPEDGSYTGSGAVGGARQGTADDAAVLDDLDLGDAEPLFADEAGNVGGAAAAVPDAGPRAGSGPRTSTGPRSPFDFAAPPQARRGGGGGADPLELLDLPEPTRMTTVRGLAQRSDPSVVRNIMSRVRSATSSGGDAVATFLSAASEMGMRVADNGREPMLVAGDRDPSESKDDGFRFDPTQGFVRRPTTAAPTTAASQSAATAAAASGRGAASESRHGANEVRFSRVGDEVPHLGHVVSSASEFTSMYRLAVPTGTLLSPSSAGSPRIQVMDCDTGLAQPVVCPPGTIRAHAQLFSVSVSTFGELRALTAATWCARAIHASRRALVALLLTWPQDVPFGLQASRGPSALTVADVMAVVKLVAASEDAFVGGGIPTGAGLGVGNGGCRVLPAGAPLMGALQLRLKAWLLEEVAGEAASGKALAASVVEEVAINMLAATNPMGEGAAAPVDRKMRESLHPHYHNVQQARDSVTVKGARALWITFDPRCQTHRNGALTFYADPEYRTTVMRCAGEGPNFRPFVLHGETAYFQFRSNCDDGSSGWGYRFHVQAMQGLQWLREPLVLKEPSLEWACWVLEYLLRDVQELVAQGALHNARVFNTMCEYLRARGTPYKHRVISLLTQLLKSPFLFPADDPPDMGKLRRMERSVLEHCQREMAEHGGSTVFPSRVLQLIELLTTARVAERLLAARAEGGAAGGAAVEDTWQRVSATDTAPLVPAPVPVAPPKESVASFAKVPLNRALCDVMDMTECLFRGSRLPDAIMCRAVMDACGSETTPTVEQVTNAVRLLAEWEPDMDQQLVQWATALTSPRRREELAEAAGAGAAGAGEGVSASAARAAALPKTPFELVASGLELTEDDKVTFQRLVPSADSIRLRFAVLRLFNLRLGRVMPLLDVMNAQDVYSLGYKLRVLGHCIFIDTKAFLMQASVDNTWSNPSGSGLSLNLDHHGAGVAIDKASRDPQARNIAVSNCLFVQMFKALGHKPARLFRSHLDDRGVLFKVTYGDDPGIDWGGLYREALSLVVEDLFSDHLDLFLLCPNGRLHKGLNTEKFVPNPRHTSPQALAMYEFVGRIMGIVLRHKNYLPIELPPLVWKLLVGQPAAADDIKLHDIPTSDLLRAIQTCDTTGVANDEDFQARFAAGGPLCFVFEQCGHAVELLPGGKDRHVTFENREEFVELATRLNLQQFDAAVAAMRRGVESIVPQRALRLFTWRELEVLVCGDPHVDVDLLRSKATYQGWESTHDVVQRFWRVFRSLSNADRSAFVRFAWGRARLPRAENWDKPFKLTRKSSGGDQALPIAHTCFFQVELPEYTTDDIMRRRLLACAHFGLGGFLIA